ncbi:MAG TPA: hypothetical protein VND89_01530 [Acidimicrobiales bacterium]|nr:hypothetical protein [Acidimicrobiales bacterium]
MSSLYAKEVMALHLSNSRCRVVSVAVVTLFVVSLSLAGCSAGGSKVACKVLVLTPATGLSNTTLPPSHDNDVGDGRIPDSTPDADIDANQRHKICTPSI